MSRSVAGRGSSERLALALPTWHLVRVLSGDRRGGAGADDLVVRSAVRALRPGARRRRPRPAAAGARPGRGPGRLAGPLHRRRPRQHRRR
ncbi:hypothetical protein [Georgenia sp. SUBG003]|uniref:hypothetical protein n=1 Tax=Georgenia sp. SUBG003 TaxID=1497974 RepID=UPI003AB8EB75